VSAARSVHPLATLPALAAAAGLALLVFLAALAVGSESIPLAQLWRIAVGAEGGIHADIVLGLRMPRALTAFACGGLLALAGVLMQVMLRNPLADPYVLGLAGGAGTGALAAMLAGAAAWAVTASAWAGALVSVALVLACSRGSFRGALPDADEPLRLLLTGIALAIGWAALITLGLALAPDASLRGMLFWLMGDLDGAEDFRPPLVGLAILTAAALLFARDLNVLALGASRARTLGVSTGAVRLYVLGIASAATALAVTTIGTLGFIGLIVPNAVRLAAGNDQRLVLPVCALVGGTLLVAADTVARSALAPLQLPVGAVVALAGAPIFIALLMRRGVDR
jgi:iron complex transport system permease protein